MFLRKIAAFFKFKPKASAVSINSTNIIPQDTILNANIVLKNQINLDFLREMAMGDEDFVIEMITMFIAQTPSSLNQLLDFALNQQWKELKVLAHKMKSSMAVIGIKELEEIFVNLELNAVTPDNFALILPLVLRAKQLCEAAIAELKDELVQLESQLV